MDKFLARRVLNEHIGPDGSFDDSLIKELTREYVDVIGVLLHEESPETIRYRQGYAACLANVITKMRHHNKVKATQEDLENS